MLETYYRQVNPKQLNKFGISIKTDKGRELHLQEGVHCLPRIEPLLNVFTPKSIKNLEENE